MAERIPTEEENNLASKAAIALSQAAIAKAELEKAQSQKSMAEFMAGSKALTPKEQAAIDEAIATSYKNEQAMLRDIWKGPEVKALDGTIATEGTFIESRILGQQSLNSVMAALFASLKEVDFLNGKALDLIFYQQSDQQGIELYYSVRDHVRSLKVQFEAALESVKSPIKLNDDLLGGGTTNPLLAGYAIGGVVRTVADIASLFRKDITYKNFDLTIEDIALVASFTKTAKSEQNTWKIFQPAVFPVGLIRDKATSSISNLIKDFGELQEVYVKIDIQIKEIDQFIASEQMRLLTLTDDNEKKSCQQGLLVAGKTRENLAAFIPVYIQLEKIILTVDSTTGISTRAALLRTENLLDKLESENAFVIKLQAAARGSNKVTKTLFWSTGIVHSGGAELHCLIFKKDGQIVFSETLTHYTKFKKGESI